MESCERGIPGCGTAKHIRIAQQQAACSPARLTEPDQQTSLRFLQNRKTTFDRRDNHMDKEALLPPLWIGGVIGVPRHLAKSWTHKNHLILILQIKLLNDI